MATNRSSIAPGVILIMVGTLLLLDRLGIFAFGWFRLYPLLLLGIGLLFYGKLPRDRGAVFPGTIFFLLGVFYVLRNYIFYRSYAFPYYFEEHWPVYLIIVGLAFVAMYLFRPKDWGVLIPAGVLLFFGVMFFLNTYDYLGWHSWRVVGRYWPVILIALGVMIVVNSLRRSEGQRAHIPGEGPSGERGGMV